VRIEYAHCPWFDATGTNTNREKAINDVDMSYVVIHLRPLLTTICVFHKVPHGVFSYSESPFHGTSEPLLVTLTNSHEINVFIMSSLPHHFFRYFPRSLPLLVVPRSPLHLYDVPCYPCNWYQLPGFWARLVFFLLCCICARLFVSLLLRPTS